MSAQLKVASMSARGLIILAGVLTLVAAVLVAKYFYDRNKTLQGTVEAQDGIADAAGTIAQGASDAGAGQAIVERHYTETRIEYRDRMKELEHENPDVASARNAAVPASMRLLACERRATRDRLGAAEARCDRFVEGPRAQR